MIQDLSSLGWKHYYTPGFNVVKRILDIDQNHYPEGLKKFFIINTPTIFKIIWKVVKPMLDARTLEKIFILGSDYQQTIFQHIPKKNIPKEFGIFYLNLYLFFFFFFYCFIYIFIFIFFIFFNFFYFFLFLFNFSYF